jgi:hypothetical protein
MVMFVSGGAAGWDRDEPTSADFAEALETRRQLREAADPWPVPVLRAAFSAWETGRPAGECRVRV